MFPIYFSQIIDPCTDKDIDKLMETSTDNGSENSRYMQIEAKNHTETITESYQNSPLSLILNDFST